MAMNTNSSHTIASAPEPLRPPRELACATCPNSMWFLTSRALQCYCRMMYLISWQSGTKDAGSEAKTLPVLACDGESMAIYGS